MKQHTLLILFFAITLSFAIFAKGIFAFDTPISLREYNETVTVRIGNTFEKQLDAKALRHEAHLRTEIVQNPQKQTSFANSALCPFPLSACSAFTPQYQRLHYDTQYSFFVSQTTITDLTKKFSQQFNLDAKPMHLQVRDEYSTLFDPGYDGKRLLLLESANLLSEKLRESLTHHVSLEVQLPYEIIPISVPKSAKKLGILSLIGAGSSNFSGSSSDRIFNIRHALKNFQGRLLAPKEELSFVEILGPVEEETGYRPELVIRNNKTEPEFGGGICQVSTTLFRAAVRSGLEITARRNHSYPVKYYQPVGFDATVFVPRPDLKFRNNTDAYILLYSKIQGSTLTFEIYGTRDGRRVEVTTPIVTEKKEDGSLTTTFSQTVTASDGTILIQENFPSWYDNPENYPHPDDIIYSERPSGWSKREWKKYKEEHNSA